MAKKKFDEEYYSHLLINKTKRAAFIMIFSITYFLLIFFIFRSFKHNSWVYSAFPVMLVGIPIMLFPPVEVWVYKPWQSKAQKYERHYKD